MIVLLLIFYMVGLLFISHYCRTIRYSPGGVISRKAIDIKEKLELAHAVAPFLTEKEVEFFSNFKASLSWASKFAASARINVEC